MYGYRRLTLIPLVLLAGLSPAPAPAGEESTARSIIEKSIENYKDWKSFKVDFEQTYVSALLGNEVVERGRMFLAIGEGIRWEYRKPERKIAVLKKDGETLFYIPAEKRIYLDSIAGSRTGRLYLAILTGEIAALEGFSKELVGGDSGKIRVRLRPPDKSEGVDFVLVDFNAKGYYIREITVVDDLGNRENFVFGRYERGTRLDPGLFDVEPGPGVGIIDRRNADFVRDEHETEFQ